MPNLSEMSTEDLLALRQQLAGQRMDLQQRIVDVSRQKGVDPALSLSVAHTESLFDPEATSPTGVKGLFQVTVPTGQRYGQTAQNRMDPDVSINAGVSELKRLLDANRGNVRQALAGYGDPNQGNYPDLVLAQYPRYAQMVGQGQAPPSVKDMSTEDLLRLRDQLRGPAKSTPTPAPPPSPMGTEPARIENAQGQRLRAQPGARPMTPDEQRFAPQVTPPSGPGQGKTPTPVGTYRAAVTEVQPLQTAEALQTPQRQFDPRTMDDDAILQRLGVNADLVKQSRFYKPGMFQNALVTPDSFGERLMRSPTGSVLEGVRTVLHGTEQLAARGLGAIGIIQPADVAFTEAMGKLKRAEFEQAPRPTVDVPVLGPVNVGEAAGQMMVPLPGQRGVLAAKEGGRFLANVGRGVVNAAVGGTVGGLVQPVYEPGTPGTPESTFAQQKAQQALIGGGTGAAIGLIPAVVGQATGINRGANAVQRAQQETAQAQQEAAETFTQQTQARVQRILNNERAAAEELSRAQQTLRDALDVKATKDAEAQAAYTTKAGEAYRKVVDEQRQAHQEALTAQQAYTRAERAQAAAVQEAISIPERYAPNRPAGMPATMDRVSKYYYDEFTNQHGALPVSMAPAASTIRDVGSQLSGPFRSEQPTRIQAIVRELEDMPETNVARLYGMMQDLGPLTRAKDSTTRGAAKQLYAALTDAMQAGAPPEAQALLQQAKQTWMHEQGLNELQVALSRRTGRSIIHEDPEGRLVINVPGLRSAVTDSAREMQKWLPPDVYRQLEQETYGMLGTPAIPRQRPVIAPPENLPGAMSMQGIKPPELEPMPALKTIGPVAWQPPPTLETVAPVAPTVRPPRLGRLSGEAILPTLVTLAAGGPASQTTALAGAGFAAGDLLTYAMARAWMHPQVRPLIERAVAQGGVISPELSAILGMFASELGQQRQSTEKRKTPMPVGVK